MSNVVKAANLHSGNEHYSSSKTISLSANISKINLIYRIQPRVPAVLSELTRASVIPAATLRSSCRMEPNDRLPRLPSLVDGHYALAPEQDRDRCESMQKQTKKMTSDGMDRQRKPMKANLRTTPTLHPDQDPIYDSRRLRFGIGL